jgi:hypothetical protein
MPPLSKQKRKSRDQPRTEDGKYGIKRTRYQEISDSESGQNGAFHKNVSYDGESDIYEFLYEEWGDEEDNVSDEEFAELTESKLTWKKNNQFEKMKRGQYLKGKTPKSTYYDKYGPNGLFTKAAADTQKITNFFKVSSIQDTESNSNNPNLDQTLSDSDDEAECCTYQIDERIRSLKEQLEKQHRKMSVIEYNSKRAIFEYLTRLDSGKMHASLEAAKIVFVDGGPWKA